MKTLKEFLKDWTEPEDAMYYLGCVLGIMEYHENKNSEYYSYYRKIKAVFAVQTTEGNILFDMLQQLTRDGILEKRDDWDFRWSKSFKTYWEIAE